MGRGPETQFPHWSSGGDLRWLICKAQGHEQFQETRIALGVVRLAEAPRAATGTGQ